MARAVSVAGSRAAQFSKWRETCESSSQSDRNRANRRWYAMTVLLNCEARDLR
jgi:hypothetical protein